MQHEVQYIYLCLQIGPICITRQSDDGVIQCELTTNAAINMDDLLPAIWKPIWFVPRCRE